MTSIGKIAVIGGGSTYTPELVDGFILHRGEIDLRELVLHDIVQERLEIVGGLVTRMLQHAGLDTKVILTLDRKEAIADADFVISQIRIK